MRPYYGQAASTKLRAHILGAVALLQARRPTTAPR
jgi:hypothetical protein